jgi:hypothetical protein
LRIYYFYGRFLVADSSVKEAATNAPLGIVNEAMDGFHLANQVGVLVAVPDRVSSLWQTGVLRKVPYRQEWSAVLLDPGPLAATSNVCGRITNKRKG